MKAPNATGMLCVAVAAALVIMEPAAALEERSTSSLDGSLRKLGRGLANIATGPAELLRTPELVGRREGYVAAVTVGVVQGVWRAILREVVGVFEVATFYAEVPDNFEPLIAPEFVWEHGGWAEIGGPARVTATSGTP